MAPQRHIDRMRQSDENDLDHDAGKSTLKRRRPDIRGALTQLASGRK